MTNLNGLLKYCQVYELQNITHIDHANTITSFYRDGDILMMDDTLKEAIAVLNSNTPKIYIDGVTDTIDNMVNSVAHQLAHELNTVGKPIVIRYPYTDDVSYETISAIDKIGAKLGGLLHPDKPAQYRHLHESVDAALIGGYEHQRQITATMDGYIYSIVMATPVYSKMVYMISVTSNLLNDIVKHCDPQFKSKVAEQVVRLASDNRAIKIVTDPRDVSFSVNCTYRHRYHTEEAFVAKLGKIIGPGFDVNKITLKNGTFSYPAPADILTAIRVNVPQILIPLDEVGNDMYDEMVHIMIDRFLTELYQFVDIQHL